MRNVPKLLHSGGAMCIFVFQAEDDFQNKKETFKPKTKLIIYI